MRTGFFRHVTDASSGAFSIRKEFSTGDVGFMNRFADCGDWFARICSELAPGLVAGCEKPPFLEGYRVIAFDASEVVEKGLSPTFDFRSIKRLH